MVLLSRMQVSGQQIGNTTFATSKINDIMNMKRTIMTLVASLAIITTATAQTTNRIPAKGFAMFSAKNA